MSAEWKPGDVAKLWIDDVEHVVLRTENPHGGWVVSGESFLADREYFRPRPLVVIDPEDRSAVAAFCDALTGRRGMPVTERLDILDRIAQSTDDMQAALREFANPTPPKPAEPTGLGAVVEDADGHKWVRANNAGEWFCECGDDVETSWSDMPAVLRVVSEGVTA